MGLSKNFAHWWLSEECAYIFLIFMKWGESIFSALVESGRFFLLWKLLIPIIGDMGIVSDLSWSASIENGLAVEAE